MALGAWWLASKRSKARTGLSLTEQVVRKFSTLEHYQSSSVDEHHFRRQPTMQDFAGWYSHSIGIVGGGPVNPGQSYMEYYTMNYATEPWIVQAAVRESSLATSTPVTGDSLLSAYSMFSRYNSTPMYRVFQAWKDVIGYGPTESVMWGVFSPMLSLIWLRQRWEERIHAGYYYFKATGRKPLSGPLRDTLKQLLSTTAFISSPALFAMFPGQMVTAASIFTAGYSLYGMYSSMRKSKRKPGLWKPHAYARCPRCGSPKPRGARCPVCGFNPHSNRF